jgi:nucleoside-diphosphate-sugar epimerase
MIAFLERQAEPDDAARVLLTELRRIDDGRERLYVVADRDGRPSISTLNDARDAADGLRRIAAAPDALGEAFNIGPAAPYAEQELADHLGERLGLPVSVVRTPFARPDWIVSSAKAQTVLGYAPTRTVIDMLDEALETAPAVTAGRTTR